jgi:hypothetical protein
VSSFGLSCVRLNIAYLLLGGELSAQHRPTSSIGDLVPLLNEPCRALVSRTPQPDVARLLDPQHWSQTGRQVPVPRVGEVSDIDINFDGLSDRVVRLDVDWAWGRLAIYAVATQSRGGWTGAAISCQFEDNESRREVVDAVAVSSGNASDLVTLIREVCDETTGCRVRRGTYTLEVSSLNHVASSYAARWRWRQSDPAVRALTVPIVALPRDGGGLFVAGASGWYLELTSVGAPNSTWHMSEGIDSLRSPLRVQRLLSDPACGVRLNRPVRIEPFAHANQFGPGFMVAAGTSIELMAILREAGHPNRYQCRIASGRPGFVELRTEDTQPPCAVTLPLLNVPGSVRVVR